MKLKVSSVADIGTISRAMRKSAKVRIDDLAATAGLSKQFVTDVELGKPGVHLGKVLQMLDELGIYVYVEAPDDCSSELERARQQIQRTTHRRKNRANPEQDSK
jgi:transcriptional regulator with XRE-family HTH domain